VSYVRRSGFALQPPLPDRFCSQPPTVYCALRLQEELAQRLAAILPKLDRAVRSGDAGSLFWLHAHVSTSM
jgi:hypothetical protein